MNKHDEVSAVSLLNIRKYLTNNYGKAFCHFLVYLELNPANRVHLRDEFVDSLFKFIKILENSNTDIRNILTCYENAINYYPNDLEILTKLSSFLALSNQHNEAIKYSKQCLIINNEHIPARRLLDYSKNSLIERWHFRMLNDKHRNMLYRQAIKQQFTNQHFDTVLDIGTGTGLLTLYLKEVSPNSKIIACDSSEIMIDIAKRVIEANHLANIELIHCSSFELSIKKVPLIVMEIVDSGFFGEGIIDTLIHCLENLLEENGKLIPMGCQIVFKCIESIDIYKNYKVLNMKNARANDTATPYDSINLSDYNINYLTDDNDSMSLNFYDLELLKSFREFQKTISFKCLNDGEIHAVVMNFKLDLTKQLSINTSAGNGFCWDQAVFYLDEPLIVVKNEIVEFFLRIQNNKITIKPCERLRQMDLVSVDSSVIKFLNDDTLQLKLKEMSNLLLKNNNLTVFDISPFPSFGVSFVKDSRVVCLSRDKNNILKLLSDDDKHRIEFVDDLNGCVVDVVYVHVFDSRGVIDSSLMGKLQFLKNNCTNCVVLPKTICLYAQIVQSDWLDQMTFVDDDNLGGFRVAEFINDYQSEEFLDLVIGKFKYEPLSDKIKLAEMNCLNKTKITKQVEITNDGNANAVLYWFDIELYEGIFATTNRINSFMNMAAFLVNPKCALYKNDKVHLDFIQMDGYYQIFIEK